MTRKITSRRAVVAGGLGIVLAGAAVGAAAAQPAPPREPTFEWTASGPIVEHRGKLLDAVARRLGVDRAKLEQAFAEASKEVGPPGDFLLPAPFPGGPIGVERVGLAVAAEGGKRAFFVDASSDHETIAKLLGITVDQLRQEQAGKSLADVARAHGVEPSAVVDALKADAVKRIDEAAARGDLTADMAGRLKDDVGRAIQKMVERRPGDGPPIADKIVRALELGD